MVDANRFASGASSIEERSMGNKPGLAIEIEARADCSNDHSIFILFLFLPRALYQHPLAYASITEINMTQTSHSFSIAQKSSYDPIFPGRTHFPTNTALACRLYHGSPLMPQFQYVESDPGKHLHSVYLN